MTLDSQEIETLAPGWRVECHDEVTSTNDLARTAGQSSAAGHLVIFAEAQTAGRGQRSQRWITPKGLDLMFSILLRPEIKLEHWPRLTTMAALSVCKAIEATLPLIPKIKWPNDIYLADRKVCGLLAETFVSATGPFLVLGIGLNVNAISFAPELHGIATSLLRELPATLREIDREVIAAAMLNELNEVMTLWDSGYQEVISEVRARSLLTGRNIRAKVNGQEIHGRVIDLNHEGHLVLQLADGSSQALSSAAEVRW
jgi:BirA family biotin operon repressor/biotin-[acetyl-CoA-carboxylase] ligase